MCKMVDPFDKWLQDHVSHADVDDGRLLAGTVVDGYKIEALLGRGGFAEVYAATTSGGERVAIKILHRLDEQSRLRFERESNILSQVHHPNFPKLLSFGSCGARPYVVTELMRGGNLPQKDREVARYLLKVISAVEELHRKGYVHRDIKPANILERPDGEPVLIDFGLAAPISEVDRAREALSEEGERKLVVGTVGYSAPEQFSGQGAGCAADVHAIGAILGACFGEKMPSCWKRIYLHATSSNPKARYQTVGRLRGAIRVRHAWRYGLAILFVTVLGLVAYISVEKWSESQKENKPNHFKVNDI